MSQVKGFPRRIEAPAPRGERLHIANASGVQIAHALFLLPPLTKPLKVALYLEEAGLAYELVPIDTRKAGQHSPTFVAIKSNATTPVLVDSEAMVFKLLRALPKLRALRQAVEGERAVGQYLERLREDGFHVFHDIVATGFNVDHVLIGPSGVYTVETKTWSKPTKGNPKIIFDGQSIKVGSLEPDRDPVTQAHGQAGWLKAVLAESTGRKVDARPVILFPGWFIEKTARGQTDVWVLEPKALPAFLSNEPTRLSLEDVKLYAYHLSRMIRVSEGGNKVLA